MADSLLKQAISNRGLLRSCMLDCLVMKEREGRRMNPSGMSCYRQDSDPVTIFLLYAAQHNNNQSFSFNSARALSPQFAPFPFISSPRPAPMNASCPPTTRRSLLASCQCHRVGEIPICIRLSHSHSSFLVVTFMDEATQVLGTGLLARAPLVLPLARRQSDFGRSQSTHAAMIS